ncbi:hypothetical protein [Adhaeribacter rhizoryzae]|uniref:Uncharacterized protein n=1 Tax=Adhaeribacter rhizoryzae TaxID=2607907 RepID=A0A5M6DBU7_9BACT|nr:hypothetical protein [Adhaeribacter rhizoryzae]KAA5543956.1 hypothetical protein F0145_15360 [Adhaeribacter rhizoryzae]
MDLDDFSWHQQIEKKIALRLGLSDLTVGPQIIRDEKGWRDNEIRIKYIWIATVSRSFVGNGGVFSLKFEETSFREKRNPARLVQGVFITGQQAQIPHIYFEEEHKNFTDNIKDLKSWDLFEPNNGIALDGVSYRFHVLALNSDVTITLNNPQSEPWKKWEDNIWDLGKRLSANSKTQELIGLFE